MSSTQANIKIEKLMKKRNQIDARIRLETARENTRQRKMETREKILIGALVKEMMAKDKLLEAKVYQNLETFLVRSIDREACGLAPKEEKKEKPKAVAEAKQETAKAHKSA